MNSRKIKIGILSKKITSLRSFEFRIFDEIFKNENLEIEALFFDGRKINKLSFIDKLNSLIKSKKIFSRVLLKIQEIIESIIFKDNSFIPNADLLKKISSIKKIYLYPTQKGFLDVFSNEDCEKVKKFNLDLIIRTEFNIIHGEILNCLKYGIWSFHHGDNRVNRGGPPCFWELIERHKNVGVTLQKLTPDLDGGKIIDRGSYNPHWSWIKTKRKVYDSSVILLMKNLNLLTSNSFNLEESSEYFNKIYKFPTLKFSVIYMYRFYREFFSRVLKKLSYYLFNIKHNHWTLVLSKGNFLEIPINEHVIINTPKNEFWADPFILERDKSKYVFFENYNYKTKLGKISCGRVLGNEIVQVQDSLIKNYHLSYPFIYEINNKIFMIPETSNNNRLEVYICENFPNKWSLFSTAFDGEKIIDCNVYNDEENNTWLFLNKKKYESDGCSDLYIYLIDSLKFNKITPHRHNPVITDSKKARNAGPIFSHNNKIFRPSQINIDGKYGFGLNLNEIVNLSLDDYNEQIYSKYLSDFDTKYSGLHHIHYNKNFSVFDLCKNKY